MGKIEIIRVQLADLLINGLADPIIRLAVWLDPPAIKQRTACEPIEWDRMPPAKSATDP